MTNSCIFPNCSAKNLISFVSKLNNLNSVWLWGLCSFVQSNYKPIHNFLKYTICQVLVFIRAYLKLNLAILTYIMIVVNLSNNLRVILFWFCYKNDFIVIGVQRWQMRKVPSNFSFNNSCRFIFPNIKMFSKIIA